MRLQGSLRQLFRSAAEQQYPEYLIPIGKLYVIRIFIDIIVQTDIAVQQLIAEHLLQKRLLLFHRGLQLAVGCHKSPVRIVQMGKHRISIDFIIIHQYFFQQFVDRSRCLIRHPDAEDDSHQSGEEDQQHHIQHRLKSSDSDGKGRLQEGICQSRAFRSGGQQQILLALITNIFAMYAVIILFPTGGCEEFLRLLCINHSFTI